MANKAPPQSVEVRPNVRAIIGPDPTVGLVQVFAGIDEYQRKEREKFAQQLAAIGASDGQTQVRPDPERAGGAHEHPASKIPAPRD